METNNTSDLRCGIIGLGAMGSEMARNLHQAGFLYRVWNRTGDKATMLASELGTTVANSPVELAGDCSIIIISVSADHDVLEVINAIAPATSFESIVIDTSTVNRDTAYQAAKRLQTSGAAFLDAPVSGGVEGARNGTLALMVGGKTETLDRARPVLEAISGHIEHMGPVGAGQSTKAVNQVMAAGINQAVTEALAFANTLELPLDKVIDIVGSGAAANWFLTHRGPSMTSGQFDPGFKLALHHKDLSICKAMAKSFNVAMPVVEMTLIHYRRLMQAGYGEEDISALFREKLALFERGPDRPAQP